MTDKIRIVIVEDDPQIAEIQKRFLERISDVELVGIAHRLGEAEDIINVLQPDLLLLDIQFPDGNGLDLLRNIRAAERSTDIILITAARETETLRTALHFGIFDYILKPLVFDRLRDTLQNYIAHIAKLNTLGTIAQNDVDHFLGNASGDTSQSNVLPKGVDALTLNKVVEVIKDASIPLNADEVGKQIHASRTTARRYLEHLVTRGDLIAEVSYGSVGRPERRYRKT